MRRRAELVDETRQRITEATVRLHTTVGPAHTSIAAVAEEAGVTRLTVYRHFADLDALFEACTAHWYARNPAPNAAAWSSIADPQERARRAFGDLYGWFRAHGDALYPIYRDIAAMPVSAREAIVARNEVVAETLVGRHADGGSDGDARLLRAVARHLVDFLTWHSLAIKRGLDDQEVVEVAVRLLMSMTGDVRRRDDGGRGA